MIKRKEFMLGAAGGLAFAAALTAGGVIDWPAARAETPAAAARPLSPSAGAAGLAFAPPQGAPLSFADIFDQVAPAVVQINVRTRIATPNTVTIPGTPFRFQLPPGATPPGGQDEDGDQDRGIQGMGTGSGFFITQDGYIVTNNHVVENAEEITVVLSDERELTARLVGRDEGTDLAVLKVEGDAFPFVSFEETAKPRVGDWVIAVGNPFGLGGTATAGIVSAQGRDVGGRETPFNDFLQIDAAINRGNSGGPTFDIYGRVIGVYSAIYSPTGGSVGIGFAIPADVAKPITDRLMRGETIQRGYLGVQIGDVAPALRESMGLAADFRGAFVNEVTPGGPGEAGGLQAGDIVVAINGETIRGASELTRRVGAARPGETLRLDIMRDGRRQTVNVRSGTRPSTAELYGGAQGAPGQRPEDRPSASPSSTEVAGLSVTPITPALRTRYSIPETVQGLVITEVSSVHRQVGFQPGYVILRAGNRAAASVADFEAAVAESRRAGRNTVFLLVRTPDGNSPVALELPAAE